MAVPTSAPPKRGVGDFTTTLSSVNPALTVSGYPEDWTLVTATVSGLAAPIDGRVAFRYFVTDGGPTGINSSIIGVDTFSYVAAVPEPATWALMLVGCGRAGRTTAPASPEHVIDRPALGPVPRHTP